jgi:hypothetical protein
MTFNPMAMIHEKVQSDFHELLASVRSAEGQRCTADEMERHLFEALMQLGAELLQWFFALRSQAEPREAVVTEAGAVLPYYGERQRQYLSVFGALLIQRPYFYQREAGGQSPLDRALGLGEDCYSDFLRELEEEVSVHLPYAKASALLGRLLGRELSTRQLAQFIEQDATDVEAFYEEQPPPPASQEGTILVVQADGKGVPLVSPTPSSGAVRLQRGEARSRKKVVVVTTLYTIHAAPRTAEEVLCSLFNEEMVPTEAAPSQRTRPQHKQLWGTLAGKAPALTRLARQVAKRDGAHIQQRVMLCDGDKSLQGHLRERFPHFVLIVDFIHAYEHLWQAATGLYGQDERERWRWVREQTARLLTSQVAGLVEQLRQRAEEAERTLAQQQLLQRLASYFENNRAYMDYAVYLQHGWPIASGVIEGACRHFVKDRLELSGMRWSEQGAEQLLRLRAVAENDDWQAYHRFRKQRRQQRLYGCAWPGEVHLQLATLAPVFAKAARPSSRLLPRSASPTDDHLPLAA